MRNLVLYRSQILDNQPGTGVYYLQEIFEDNSEGRRVAGRTIRELITNCEGNIHVRRSSGTLTTIPAPEIQDMGGGQSHIKQPVSVEELVEFWKSLQPGI